MKVVDSEQAAVYELMAENKISLNYQPVINYREQKVYCIEALLNWTVFSEEVFDTEHFISQIENDTELSLALDSYVLLAATRDFSNLCQTCQYDGCLSVNISPNSLESECFVGHLKKLFLANEDALPLLDPSKLILEITERVPWANPDIILEAIAELTALGVRIAVDDVITGYANFGVLLNENVTIVKIDRCITKRLLEQESVRIFAEQFKELAHHLKKTVIVEGIEESEQASWLDSHGYQLFQGYFFSRPTSIEGIARYLHDRSGCIRGTQ